MDPENLQLYYYVRTLLTKMVEFRTSSVITDMLNYNTYNVLKLLTNIASDQHNADELQPELMMPVNVGDISNIFSAEIADEGSMDEYLLLQKILELKEKCSVANAVEQI